jgi:hypothetical protein
MMPIPPVAIDWGTTAAIISAMIDVIQLGRETFSSYFAKYKSDPETQAKGAALEKALSTYTPEEIDAILARIGACRERFIDEGAGKNRQRCLCSVLKDVKDGNGGTIPDPQWNDYYNILGCDSL